MRRATLPTLVVALVVALTAGAAWAVTFNPVQCTATNPCKGTDAADRIFGTEGANDIRGNTGDDQIVARGGDDAVDGGEDNDTMNGEEGEDTIRGSFGNDYAVGGSGPDAIYGGPGEDTMKGQENSDTIYAAGDASNRDFVDCGTGRDVAYLDSNDVVDGVEADTLIVNTALDCERIYVNGVLIPTGP